MTTALEMEAAVQAHASKPADFLSVVPPSQIIRAETIAEAKIKSR